MGDPEKDPEDGPAVAGSIFTAVIIYVVSVHSARPFSGL